MTASFFGYGSLVNAGTHNYQNLRPVTLQGWRRHWVQSSRRAVAFLSVTPDPLSSISGLVADVGDIGWDALDQREAAYDRLVLDEEPLRGVAMYKASAAAVSPENLNHPILLSYLDCVVQGFHQVFGKDGVGDFFRSTSGWDTPILNDRATPLYPRAGLLSDTETALVDDHINMVGARIVAPT
ncbi:gamma-glutamylcyclotransferase family protein [Neptunicoccus sediminis]|uniref:gamma-glutamylcyclotransferase family protein n=1 Tax=Neptunicoccus sediminis TaxID=1892596 RepID=UPI0008460541|nr:gamma-glutamylcyclotransferase family protein [Neptunicoccus sediminis]